MSPTYRAMAAKKVLSTVVEAYRSVVVKGADVMANTENMMRYSLYLIPFQKVTDKASETVIEGAYATIGSISLLHDLLYFPYARSAALQLHSQLRSMTTASPLPGDYSRKYEVPEDIIKSFPEENEIPLSSALSFVTCFEVFAEMMAAARYGDRNKWQAVFVVEVIKAFLRTLMLIRNDGGMVVQSHAGLPGRLDLVSRLSKAKEGVSELSKTRMASVSLRKTILDEARENGYEDKVPRYRSSGTSFLLVISELLNIARPALYVFCLLVSKEETRKGKGWRSWIPFLLSLAVDIMAKRLAKLHSSVSPFNEVEEREVMRRKSLLLLYLLRAPFFELVAPLCAAVTPSALHGIGAYIQSYRNHYFYCSGS